MFSCFGKKKCTKKIDPNFQVQEISNILGESPNSRRKRRKEETARLKENLGKIKKETAILVELKSAGTITPNQQKKLDKIRQMNKKTILAISEMKRLQQAAKKRKKERSKKIQKLRKKRRPTKTKRRPTRKIAQRKSLTKIKESEEKDDDFWGGRRRSKKRKKRKRKRSKTQKKRKRKRSKTQKKS